MIDTHCHLTDPRLFEQLDAVLSRAAAAGVRRCVTIGTDLADDKAAVALCKNRDSVRCAIGVHPNYVAQSRLEDLDEIRQLAADPAVVALGEMGLDYHYGRDTRELQLQFLTSQLTMATELKLPVVIHCREAVDDTLAVLADFPAVGGVFHCFTGTVVEAERVLAAGYLIGLTGVVTFKNSESLREVARLVPADRLLVETDAPYLSPEPLRRQKINEPALVVHTAAAVAAARGASLEGIDQQTSANAMRFYNWAP